MYQFSIPDLERTSAQSRSAAGFPGRKMGLIYAGPMIALELLLVGLSLLIQDWMQCLSGLSALGTASMLDTAQVVVSLLPVILTPFW